MNKKISISITPAEEQELEQVLMDDPELWYSFEMLQAVMKMENVPEEFIKEIQQLFEERPADINQQNTVLPETVERYTAPVTLKRKKYRFLSLAAVCTFFMLSIGLLIMKWRKTTDKPLVAMNEIIVPKGSKTHITLADGTAIWLNAGSKLVYPKNFSMENREVYLVGEAYFKVVHSAKYLFVVHTAESEITDLGTTFNVKAYPGSLTTETTLIEGAVQVTLKNNPEMKIMMKPKQKLVLNHGPETAEKGAVANNKLEPKVMEVFKITPYGQTNDIIETAWVNDKLIFRQQRFSELVKEMERRYNVSILIDDDAIKDYQLSGIFTTENVEQALTILQQIAPFKFKINNDRIYITR
jgi:ferric-dicitrate binding protein FerR (iron transport regulator)